MKKILVSVILLGFFFLLPCVLLSGEEMKDEDKAKFGLAQSLNNMENFSKSEEILKELHSKYPGNDSITLEFAKSLGYGKKLNEARPLLEQLERAYPEDENIKSVYATVLEANQQFAEARDRYAELLKKNPSDEKLKLKLAGLSAWMGDYATARKYYEELLSLHPGDNTLKLQMADLVFWARDYEETVRLYGELAIKPETDKKRYENLGYAYLGLGRYNEAVKLYEELCRIYKGEVRYEVDRANALYAAGRVNEAEKEFQTILKEHPEETEVLLRLAEILAARRDYDSAVKLCRDMLAKDPANKEASLYLARILSWQREYKESLNLYYELVTKNPDWVTPYRERARVLGWMRHYQESNDYYRAALEKFSSDNTLKLEANAKSDYYRLFDARAIGDYKKWLEEEPNDLEALFDLGQVYSRQMQWGNARAIYERTLRVMPEHYRAKQALEKVNLYSRSPSVEMGFEFYKALGGQRDVREKYYDFYSSLRTPALFEGLYLSGREDTFIYKFKNPYSVVRQRFGIGAEFYRKPYFWARAGYSYSIYTNHLDNSHNFNEEINVKPLDFLKFHFSHLREDVLDNGETATRGLRRDDFRFRGDFEPDRRLAFGSDYKYSHFTDRNVKNTYGVDVSYKLLHEPTMLKLAYRYEAYGFDKPRDYYFAPHSFHTNKPIIEWKHYLNREELFWGINETYYTLRYAINFDVNHNTGHIIYADFHREWTNRFSTHFEWSKTMYEEKGVYGEDKLVVYAKYYF